MIKAVVTGLAPLLLLTLSEPALAQSRKSQNTSARQLELPVREKLNAWTVGLAGGLLEGAPIRLATEIARAVDDGDNLHVLPIITRGPAENVEALLYLKGVDAAVINTDTLEQFKSFVPDIQERIAYILNLFPSELHVFVRPEINSLRDLEGKRVNFNTPGTAAAYSGPLIFERLGIGVNKTFIPHQVAIEQMKAGDMDAVVFVTSKPVDAFARGTWPTGFKFLPVEYDSKFEDYYIPSTLEAADYPQLIPSGSELQTIAVPTVLASFNWAPRSERYRRVERLVETLFDRIGTLQKPGFHPKWKDVNLAASVPGLRRFPAAQEWLDRHNAPSALASSAVPAVDLAFAREQVRRAAPSDRATQERLFREFMDWRTRRR